MNVFSGSQLEYLYFCGSYACFVNDLDIDVQHCFSFMQWKHKLVSTSLHLNYCVSI